MRPDPRLRFLTPPSLCGPHQSLTISSVASPLSSERTRSNCTPPVADASGSAINSQSPFSGAWTVVLKIAVLLPLSVRRCSSLGKQRAAPPYRRTSRPGPGLPHERPPLDATIGIRIAAGGLRIHDRTTTSDPNLDPGADLDNKPAQHGDDARPAPRSTGAADAA